MQRFYNNPSNAQAKFNHYAYSIHPMNMRMSFQRGGIRLF